MARRHERACRLEVNSDTRTSPAESKNASVCRTNGFRLERFSLVFQPIGSGVVVPILLLVTRPSVD